MDATGRFLRKAASGGLSSAGDRLVEVVHQAVTGSKVKGDPEKALEVMVQEGALTPEAALYLGGLRQVLCELAQATKG